MRVGNINNSISFGKGMTMAIPTDIGKMIKTANSAACVPVFGIKPIAIPVSDTFVHVLK